MTIGTWIAAGALAVTLAGAVFSAGDAKQQLSGHAVALAKVDGRVTALEHDMTDVKSSLARIEQYSRDTRDTTHRLERGHVYSKVED